MPPLTGILADFHWLFPNNNGCNGASALHNFLSDSLGLYVVSCLVVDINV